VSHVSVAQRRKKCIQTNLQASNIDHQLETTNNRTYQVQDVGYAVVPLNDCPHFELHFDVPMGQHFCTTGLANIKMSCEKCHEELDVLKCKHVGCSRYKKSHDEAL